MVSDVALAQSSLERVRCGQLVVQEPPPLPQHRSSPGLLAGKRLFNGSVRGATPKKGTSEGCLDRGAQKHLRCNHRRSEAMCSLPSSGFRSPRPWASASLNRPLVPPLVRSSRPHRATGLELQLPKVSKSAETVLLDRRVLRPPQVQEPVVPEPELTEPTQPVTRTGCKTKQLRTVFLHSLL